MGEDAYKLHDLLLSVVVVLEVELFVILNCVVQRISDIDQLLLAVYLQELHLFLLVFLPPEDLGSLFLQVFNLVSILFSELAVNVVVVLVDSHLNGSDHLLLFFFEQIVDLLADDFFLEHWSRSLG